MRVVFLHGQFENVGAIQECLKAVDPKRAEQVLFTTNSLAMRLAVVEAGKGGEGAFVVGTSGGLNFSRHNTVVELRNRWPRMLSFLYASLGTADRLHGIIPRPTGDDHRLLARVLAFATEAERVTVEQIVEQFPEVVSNEQSVK